MTRHRWEHLEEEVPEVRRRTKARKRRLSGALLDIFQEHHWEGNVREMENCIIQGILFSQGEDIEPDDVKLSPHRPPVVEKTTELAHLTYKAAKEAALQEFNHRFIGTHLSDARGNITQAAKRCGLERQALQQIMRRYNIKPDPYRE